MISHSHLQWHCGSCLTVLKFALRWLRWDQPNCIEMVGMFIFVPSVNEWKDDTKYNESIKFELLYVPWYFVIDLIYWSTGECLHVTSVSAFRSC